MISKQKNAERAERRQQKHDAGPMSGRYPEVASIVITMDYYQKGMASALMQRTVNFFPGSAAYFLMECLKHDCINGGFDLEPVITTMVRDRQESGAGKIVCPGNNASGHTRVDYKITMQYN